MLAVSNTSPLSNLAIIGRLDLLEQRYGSVRIPPAVAQELDRLGHSGAQQCLAKALSTGWLRVDDSAGSSIPPLPFPLDAGETAAIALALAVKADVLLMDERRGRIAARQAGLTVAGVLGELLHAKLVGKLPLLRLEIGRLRSEAGFFIDAGVEQFILSQGGE